MRYRSDIDGLRSIAIVPVVLYHAGLGFPGGFVGVDVFFVISGFLITSILLEDIANGTYSLLGFYDRRIRRILPALTTVMLASAVAGCFLLIPEHLVNFGESMMAASVFSSNIYFYRTTGYFNEAANLKPLLHTWSLAVEEQYYIVAPLALALLLKLFRSRVLFAFTAMVLLISLVSSENAVSRNPEAAFYLLSYRLWELMAGSLLAIMVRERWGRSILSRNGASVLSGLTGIAAICWSVFVFDAETPFPGFNAIIPVCGAVLLIASGSYQQGIVQRLLGSRGPVAVGKISYSLYLWHWPVIVYLGYVSIDGMSRATSALAVVLSTVLAVISWRFIEQPFRKRVPDRRPWMTVLGGLAMLAATGLVGLVLVRFDGFPARLPEEVRVLPTPREMRQDRFECHRVTPQRAAGGDVCIRGDLSVPPTFILLGDSHADAVSPAVFAAADEVGLSGYQFSGAGMMPLPGIRQVSRGAGYDEVEADAFRTFLKERPEITHVILVGFWPLLTSGYSYRHEGDVIEDANYDGQGASYNKLALLSGLERLFSDSPQVEFIVLDDVPSGNDLHLPVAERRIMLGQSSLGAEKGLEAVDALRQAEGYEGVLRQAVSGAPNAVYVPVLRDVYCGEAYCPLFMDGYPIFRDGDHLSAKGAMLAVEALRTRVFEPFLR